MNDDHISLGFLQKYELCKERMLTTFLNVYRKTENPEKAFELAKRSLRNCVASWQIKSGSQILGLYGELIYFRKCFREQSLTAEMAIGSQSDFRGKISGQPAAIDVTTNPYYKSKDSFSKVPGHLKNGWDYYLGVVDIGRADSEMFPLLLPICEDGEIGFFVLVFDTVVPSSINLWGESADTQYIVRYNPRCGGDELDAIEQITCEYNYILSNPSDVAREITDTYADWGVEYRGSPKFKQRLEKDVARHFNDVVLEFRKLSGLLISAVVGLDKKLNWRDEDFDYFSRQYWVHPHQYVRRILGNPGEIIDYNISAYLHNVPESFRRRSRQLTRGSG